MPPQFPTLPMPRFAPLSVPLERRLQTLAIVCWLALPFVCLGALSMLALTSFLVWPLLIPYLFWMSVLDRAPEEGGRRLPWLKHLYFPFQCFSDYFPAKLVKEVDLDPDTPHLFGYHPHGILGLGVFSSFISDGTGFTRTFPGIDLRVATLNQNFRVPLWRELLLWIGFCGVSRETCDNLFTQKQKLRTLGTTCARCLQRVVRIGSVHALPDASFEKQQDATLRSCLCQSPLSLVIAVGGASEALDAHPGTYDLILHRRSGIFRLAYRHGIPLVPVLSFGENDTYQQLNNPKGSWLRKAQSSMLKWLGFSTPIFWGRGVFNYDLGLLPRRTPIITVVGKPIRPKEQKSNPSPEDIDALKQVYIEELQRLFDKYKNQFAPQRRKSLTIVY